MTKKRLEQIIDNHGVYDYDDVPTIDVRYLAAITDAVNEALEEVAKALVDDDCYWHNNHAALVRALKVMP